MRWRVELSGSARKQLRAIRDKRLRARIVAALQGLEEDPRPEGVKKLAGSGDAWRVRVGDWRIVYEIVGGRLVVLIVTIAPRGKVYRSKS